MTQLSLRLLGGFRAQHGSGLPLAGRASTAWTGHARGAPGGDGAVAGRAAREGFRVDEAPFDDWLATERHRVRELSLTALEKLLALELTAGALEQAVGIGLRLLALDPLRESVHRTLMDVYVAVMDAVGSKRATLVGYSEGGSMCALFAATYPDRAAALVMIGSYARQAPAHPWGPSAEDYAGYIDMVQRDWGGPIEIARRAPSAKDDEAFRRWWARFLRMSASPGAAAALLDINRDLDLRHVLPAIRVPTLVLHAVGDQTIDVRDGRYMAARIPGARYVELPGADHLPLLADAEAIGAEIEQFVAEPDPDVEPDRVHRDGGRARATARENGQRRSSRSDAGGHPPVPRAHPIRGRAVRGRLDHRGDLRRAGPGSPVCERHRGGGARRLGVVAKAGLHTRECNVHPETLNGACPGCRPARRGGCEGWERGRIRDGQGSDRGLRDRVRGARRARRDKGRRAATALRGRVAGCCRSRDRRCGSLYGRARRASLAPRVDVTDQ